MKVHPIDPPSDAPAANANPSRKSLSCLCLLPLILAMIGIGLGVLHMEIQLHNRKLITTYPKLKIDSLTASNFTLSSGPNQFYADWSVKMTLETKNSHGYLSFSNMTVCIYYNVLQAGLTSVVPFDVFPHNSTTHFDVKFSGSTELIDDSIINDINGPIGAAGTLIFDVMFQASVMKSFKGRWTDGLQLQMDCKDIKLFFGYSDKSRAQMLDSPHDCNIGDIEYTI